MRANLVLRDGFASFYFHPFLDLDLLERTVEGIEAAGDTFVDPRTLSRAGHVQRSKPGIRDVPSGCPRYPVRAPP